MLCSWFGVVGALAYGTVEREGRSGGQQSFVPFGRRMVKLLCSDPCKRIYHFELVAAPVFGIVIAVGRNTMFVFAQFLCGRVERCRACSNPLMMCLFYRACVMSHFAARFAFSVASALGRVEVRNKCS